MIMLYGKKQRNKVNRMVLAAKNKYSEKSCEEAKGSSKKMWKVINKVLDRKPKPNVSPDHVKIKDTHGKIKKTKCKVDIDGHMTFGRI